MSDEQLWEVIGKDTIPDLRDLIRWTVQETKRNKRKISSRAEKLWPNPITYVIGPQIPPSAIIQAVAALEKETCVRFRRQVETPVGDHMRFFKGSGCYSPVGMNTRNNTTKISVGSGCTKIGTLLHEIGHALGLWHEQSRPDRDRYVKIKNQNVIDGHLNRFGRKSSDDIRTYNYPYDFGSIMHFNPRAFGREGWRSVESQDPNYEDTYGQRERMSFYDIKFLNAAYCRDACVTRLRCQHNGYVNPNNCTECKCPDGFGGQLCEREGESTTECGETISTQSTWNTISTHGLRTCKYLLKAPLGKQILIQVRALVLPKQPICSKEFLEVGIGRDLANTGYRFCNIRPRRTFRSERKEAVVIYTSNSADGRLSFRYRFDPPDTTTVATPTYTTNRDNEETDATTSIRTDSTPTTSPTKTSTQTDQTTTTTKTTVVTTGTNRKPSGWTQWSSCSATCGACGRQRRSRRCRDSAMTTCQGYNYESRACNLAVCTNETLPCCFPFLPRFGLWCDLAGDGLGISPSVFAWPPRVASHPSPLSWSAWGGWSTCTAQCGACGEERRERRCLRQQCEGDSMQIRVCGFKPCAGCGFGPVIKWRSCGSSQGLRRMCPIRRPKPDCPCCESFHVENEYCVVDEVPKDFIPAEEFTK